MATVLTCTSTREAPQVSPAEGEERIRVAIGDDTSIHITRAEAAQLAADLLDAIEASAHSRGM